MNYSYKDLTGFLISLGADRTMHSGRSLLEHLAGTYDLLKSWNNSPEVCIAGLFHSVYGTSDFHTQLADRQNREILKGLIGEKAECLVYLFGVCEKTSFVKNMRRKRFFVLKDTFAQKEVAVAREDFCSLIEISLANLLEQLPYVNYLLTNEVLMGLSKKWRRSEAFVSSAAYEQFCEYFAAVALSDESKIGVKVDSASYA